MRNIKFMHNFFVFFIFMNFLHYSICGVCDLCVCSQSEDFRIVNCEGKREIDNYTEIFDLLAFDDYKTIGKLILSKHEITSLPLDAFRDLKGLKSLDLSENSIVDVEADIFRDLINLEELDFSFNLLTALSGAVFDKIPSLLKLNLSNNQLSDLNDTTANQLPNLTHLDISHNHLTTFDTDFIKSLLNLQFLDVSFNRISSLPGESLLQLRFLSDLRVTNNLLKSISRQDFPESLRSLSVGHNLINSLPFDLSQIRSLNIENNKMTKLEDDAIWYKELQILNISGNQLTAFPDVQFDDLRILDLSRNILSIIPETLSSKNLPVLETLIIDENPMKTLKFKAELRLRNLLIRRFGLLEIIDEDSFGKLKEFENECINLTISENRILSHIKKGALDGIEICSLDLSKNALTRISPEVIKFQNKFVSQKGIDLQGNPFNCDCESQWMLNDLVPHLYVMNPKLLEDLRCATPLELSGTRMVHWFKWKKRVFCDTSPEMLSKMTINTAAVLTGTGNSIRLESSRGMLIVVAAAVGTLSALVIVGIFVGRKIAIRRRRFNRRL